MNRNLTILIAEDDENYAFLLEKALKQNGRTNPMHVVPNGDEVIKYLRGSEKYADRNTFGFPAVMFLDLKMPGTGGFEVLRWMQANPHCRVTPTLVLSSSTLEGDIELAYALGANAFMSKPAEYNDLRRMLNDSYNFWAWCAKPALPKCPTPAAA